MKKNHAVQLSLGDFESNPKKPYDKKQFVFEFQPYGTLVLENCYIIPEIAFPNSPDYIKHRVFKGMVRLIGTVVEGGFTSRLFQHTHFDSMVGQEYEVDCVTPFDLLEGRKVRVAM